MKNIIIITLLICSFFSTLLAQTNSTNDSIYFEVDEKPVFPGGEEALETYIIENNEYHDTIIENGIMRALVVKFLVEKNGSLSNIEILSSINNNYDESAIRLIKKMPKWTPAKYNGKAVRAYYHLTLEYKVEPYSSYTETSAALPDAPEITIVDDEVEEESVEIEMIGGGAYVEDMPIIESENQENPVYAIVEEAPEFVGGQKAMYKYINENINYPENSKSKGIEGTVFVSFVVEKDGSTSDVKVLRGINDELNNEAFRLVKSMPKWKPGKQRGRIVRSQFNLPIKFVIN